MCPRRAAATGLAWEGSHCRNGERRVPLPQWAGTAPRALPAVSGCSVPRASWLDF